VRRILFDKLDEIPLLLDPQTTGRLPGLVNACSLATDLGSNIPAETADITGMDAEEQMKDLKQGHAAHSDNELRGQEEREGSDDDDVEEVMHPLDEDSAGEDRSAIASQEELQAVRTIVQAYRRVRRRREANKTGLAASRARLFAECLDQALTIQWKIRTYRFVYLGILPHVLLCLEQTIKMAHETKDRAKRSRKAGASLDELEAAMDIQTKMKYSLFLLQVVMI